MALALKTAEDVASWLAGHDGFQEYASKFHENDIDGEVLFSLTERALEQLIPIIGHRVKFLNMREKLQKSIEADSNNACVETIQGHEDNAGKTPNMNKECDQQTRKKKCKRSLESKRRQRLSRNKRKREQKKQAKKGLIALINDLKEENKCLSDKVKVTTTIKEKYFEMWRVSEKEKDKIKNSKLVFHGASKQMASSKENEILHINPELLEEFEGHTAEIGKGKFGTVHLKKFRSSPVAVKYFDESASAKVIEKEALYLKKCCHINLPLIYGVNVTKKPYFIVTQYYGNESFQAITLHKIICQSVQVSNLSSEHWLHITSQLIDGLCYLHKKEVLHNDIKSDNIVIVCNANGLFSPVLIDYGKACLVKEVKRKVLSRSEKAKYYKEHYHIAPEVIEGACPQSVKSDVYSVGVVIASLYKHSMYLPLKEIAKHCLKPFSTRCTSPELLSIVLNLPIEKLK